MAYVPTTFTDRSVEFPGRRLIVPVSGLENVSTISRPDGIEGTVFEAGTMPNATNLNAEFNKIKAETDALDTSIANLSSETSILTTPITGFTNGAGKSITLSASFSSYKKLRFVFINTNSLPMSTYVEVNVSDLLAVESGIYGSSYVPAISGTCGFYSINSTTNTMTVSLNSSAMSPAILKHVYGINTL